MTDINKLAERLCELSNSSGWLFVAADAEQVCQTAANELERLETMCDGQRESLREHMAMARDAIEQCDKLRARIAELERQPIRWRPIEEAPKDREVLVWIDARNFWLAKCQNDVWIDTTYGLEMPEEPAHFAEIVGPGGEPC